MGRAELEQQKWEYERRAEAYAAQEQELRGVISTLQAELQHKAEQLELARVAQGKCEATKSAAQELVCDVEAFGTKLAAALCEPSAQQGMGQAVQGAEGLAGTAVAQAAQLVAALEAKCGALRESIAEYDAQAEAASRSAQECWDAASYLQAQIDVCQD